jgi:hypothetical protein
MDAAGIIKRVERLKAFIAGLEAEMRGLDASHGVLTGQERHRYLGLLITAKTAFCEARNTLEIASDRLAGKPPGERR